jgi:hypothetical protein
MGRCNFTPPKITGKFHCGVQRPWARGLHPLLGFLQGPLKVIILILGIL